MTRTRSSGRHSGRKYARRFEEGFISGSAFQPYGFDDEGVWGPIGDPIDLTFPSTDITNAHPPLGRGPATAQYPDLSSPGTFGSTSNGYTMALRVHSGAYCAVMMPTERSE